MQKIVEELANSLDELFLEVAEIKEQNEAIAKLIGKGNKASAALKTLIEEVAAIKAQNEEIKKILEERDKLNLVMTKHVERLAREKEFLLRTLGIEKVKEYLR
mgnify:CR=1 FL=1